MTVPNGDEVIPKRSSNRPELPLIDPTANVIALQTASDLRQDDLRKAAERRIDDIRDVNNQRLEEAFRAEARRLDDIGALRQEYDEKLREAEAKRIDAIRAVDVAAVGIANERATQQATVLANQVSTSAETLRTLVASTAATQAQQLTQLISPLVDRIGSLEKGQIGSATTSPAVNARLSELETYKSQNEGRSGISTQVLAIIAAIAGGLVMFLIEQALKVK